MPAFLAGLVLPALLACAEPAAAPAPPGIRVRVATLADWSDLGAFARRAAQASGTSVRDPSGITSRSFALTLICPDAPACDQALARLAASTDFVRAAVREQRMGVPRPIAPNDPRAK